MAHLKSILFFFKCNYKNIPITSILFIIILIVFVAIKQSSIFLTCLPLFAFVDLDLPIFLQQFHYYYYFADFDYDDASN